MSITAKELAEKLNLSQTAVSMALNNKPGVSTETRRMVVEAAEKYGYDFTRLSLKKNKAGSIYAVSYRSHNAIMSYSPIFDAMVEGMESVVQKDNYKLKVITFYEKRDNLEHYLGDLRTTDCVGIILFGTEMREEMVRPFLKLPFPVVILDAYFENLDCNYVVPNNRQGAYLATDSGIVEPMSEKALVESIHVEMKQHFTQGEKYLLVTPGNYGADYLREHMTLPFERNIKCSNYVGETIDMAVDMGVKGILFVAHIGKFVKVAAGIMNTHSHSADARMEVLASNALRVGADGDTARDILNCNTTDEALDILHEKGLLEPAMKEIMERIQFYLDHRSYEQIKLGAVVFNNVYGYLGKTRDAGELIQEIQKQDEMLKLQM